MWPRVSNCLAILVTEPVDIVSKAGQEFAGLNEVMSLLDPFELRGDLNYGTVDLADSFTSSGWVFDISTLYKMNMLAPELPEVLFRLH